MNLMKAVLVALALTFAVSAVVPSLAMAQETTDSGKAKEKGKAKGDTE